MSAKPDYALGVYATLNYLFRTEKKPYAYTFEPPKGAPARFGEVNAVSGILIRNARPMAGYLSLNKQGFELHSHDSAVTNFYDDHQIKDIYYPEVEQLLIEATGAEKIVVFDYTIRSVPKFKNGEKGVRDPVRRVHNDYTATSGRRRVRDHLAPEEAEERLRHRFLEVNVWRPIRGPLEEAPLAVCDARTIDLDDLIASDLIYPDKVGETYNLSYNPKHRWYYFPNMLKNEALLIKCFDSDKSVWGRYTAHTAFDDPTAPLRPLPRESIEVRALAFLPPE